MMKEAVLLVCVRQWFQRRPWDQQTVTSEFEP